jgi:hypothetical protein
MRLTHIADQKHGADAEGTQKCEIWERPEKRPHLQMVGSQGQGWTKMKEDGRPKEKR